MKEPAINVWIDGEQVTLGYAQRERDAAHARFKLSMGDHDCWIDWRYWVRIAKQLEDEARKQRARLPAQSAIDFASTPQREVHHGPHGELSQAEAETFDQPKTDLFDIGG